MTYKLLKDFDGKVIAVLRDGKDTVPFAEDNTDYQQYLAWLAEGNEPLPAEEAQ